MPLTFKTTTSAGAVRGLGICLFAGATLLLAGCQTTSIQSAWFDSSYRGGPFKKIVVIASDGTTRALTI